MIKTRINNIHLYMNNIEQLCKKYYAANKSHRSSAFAEICI